MGECQVHGCILCRLSDTHPIPMFWSYHQYSVQRGQHLPGDNWWYPQCTCMDFTKMSAKALKEKMDVLQAPTLCVHMFVQGGFQEQRVHSCFNVQIQQGHVSP